MDLAENIMTNTPSQERTYPPQEAEDDSLETVSLNTDKINPQLGWYEDEVDLVVLRCRD
jgi:hypothetical protein